MDRGSGSKSIRDVFIRKNEKKGGVNGMIQEQVNDAFVYMKESEFQNTIKQSSSIDSNFYSNFIDDKKKTNKEK